MNVVSNGERLAALRASRAHRQAAEAAEREAQEIAVLELEERFTRDFGTRGKQFQIVEETGEDSPVVVKLGPGILYSNFSEAKKTPVEIENFVVACLAHPDADVFRQWAARRPGLAARCAQAVMDLFEGRRADEAKKY